MSSINLLDHILPSQYKSQDMDTALLNKVRLFLISCTLQWIFTLTHAMIYQAYGFEQAAYVFFAMTFVLLGFIVGFYQFQNLTLLTYLLIITTFIGLSMAMFLIHGTYLWLVLVPLYAFIFNGLKTGIVWLCVCLVVIFTVGFYGGRWAPYAQANNNDFLQTIGHCTLVIQVALIFVVYQHNVKMLLDKMQAINHENLNKTAELSLANERIVLNSQETRRSRRLLKEVLDNLPLDIFLIQQNGRIEFANKTLQKKLRKSERALNKMFIHEVFADPVLQAIQKHSAYVFKTNQILSTEEVFKTTSYKKRYFEVGFIPLKERLSDDNPMLVAFSIDVTSKRLAEEQRRRLAEIIEKSSSLVSMDDGMGNTYMNEGGKRMLRYPVNDAMTVDFRSLFTPESLQVLSKEAIPQAMERGTWSGEVTWISREGKPIPTTQVVIAHKGSDGELEYISNIAFDITAIKEQQYVIEEKNRQIFESLTYARQIQNSILVNIDEGILPHFKEAFVWNQPKEIVSGDFCWFGSLENKRVLILADCTGHGVPAAFMTLLGTNFLNEIVLEKMICDPIEILNQLDNKVTAALNTDKRVVADGMDITVLTIDDLKGKAFFSAAKQAVCYIEEGTLYQLKGSGYPIGGSHLYKKDKNFESYEIDLAKVNTFYLFSDGFQDQFGERTQQKYMSRNFKSLLEKIHQLPMEEQKKFLELEWATWKGKEEQTDDILVIGITL